MTIHLKAGESYSLTTGQVLRTDRDRTMIPLPRVSHRTPVHPFRTPAALRANNLNALRNVFAR